MKSDRRLSEGVKLRQKARQTEIGEMGGWVREKIVKEIKVRCKQVLSCQTWTRLDYSMPK